MAVPAPLANGRSRRPGECLQFIAAHPLCSNREVAGAIGVAHRSQISSLLASLEGERLLVKRSQGAGRRNLWRLTARGEQAFRALRAR